MPNDIASVAVWQINSASQGNKRIRRMKNADRGDEASREAVPEVGSADCVGFVDKPGPKPISFNIRETKGVKPEIDWEYLQETGEVFSLTRQVVGGRRVQYPEC